ncbi:hypothetical protein LJX78_06960 [Methanimicrococcus blatticola]|uniref:hypothetical protein n=1 Tax=Methanimicrococcus blatticola TaxID=91560 RepID=UPI001E41E439|nr:hypothetical protein [Methanimicrococcus blatticola]MCC2509329.1 hypothetical protein [Methanimicrococcus blatticola]
MLLDCVSPLCCVCPLCFCASALLRASALFYHIRSLARTWTTATLRFAFLLPPYGLRFCRYLTVRVCCRPPCRRARPEQVLPKIEKDATFLQKSKTA